ncbi:uridine diphosphate glucose pyrophosphatase NUDT14 isoform X3 [Hippopotamus amphibius kiboko]|nr:uridine diphosphate glucose pyrophosphatase NUDT14 isoform X3 [Hippopotamus amphibius kiboko]XP_057587451.1 uridine diphosphate glucose pyrophosphatase NUDT14 isoform X3 [Hippopotamus amphibius kiboko]XP_057587452.1 uridine diphosphate glucose pyrophosphatase NUDT14 isoform X3 [Hippopotamus amphibius kiboko]XP_057587453.1 uridine diphosphate glucose pyrophosphatase NUDT14 isoform X3 [Hippopotamus amphibius kiboko]
MKTHDSVTVLMFNSSRRSLVLVKQFRPAVYAGEVERLFPGSLAPVDPDRPRELQAALPGSAGVTYELCAGLVDQPGLSLQEVACKEAWEECGYHLAPSDLRRVATYKEGPASQLRPSASRTRPNLIAWDPDHIRKSHPACSQVSPTHARRGLHGVWRGTDRLQPDHVLRRGDRRPAGRPGRGPGRGGRAH